MAIAAKPKLLDRLTPKQKQYGVWGVALTAFLLFAWPFVSEPANKAGAGKKNPQSIENILTGANTRELGISGLSQDLDKMKAEMGDLRKENENLRAQQNGQASGGGGADAQELAKMRDEIALIRAEKGSAPSPAPNAADQNIVSTPGVPPAANYEPSGAGQMQQVYDNPAERARAQQLNAAQQQVPLEPPVIRTVSMSDSAKHKEPAAAVKEEEATFLPAGSIISGVLLTGVDAPTGRAATTDPLPILVRVKHEAILPMRNRIDIREAFIVAACYGNLASERAYCRAESISLVRSDGKVIETRLDSWAVGEDAKAGLRGTLVNRQGSVIAKAAVAGFADGVSKAFSPSYGTLSSQGQGIAPSGTSGLTVGAYGGVSSGLDRIEQYYLALADEMVPVVEISAGRSITFLVTRGQPLKLAAR